VLQPSLGALAETSRIPGTGGSFGQAGHRVFHPEEVAQTDPQGATEIRQGIQARGDLVEFDPVDGAPADLGRSCEFVEGQTLGHSELPQPGADHIDQATFN